MISSSIVSLLLVAASPLPEGAVARFGDFRFKHEDRPQGCLYMPDGKTIVSWAADHAIRHWDAATGELKKKWKPEGITDLSTLILSKDGKQFILSGPNSGVGIFDVETGERKKHLAGIRPGPIRLAISEDGKRLLTYTANREVTCWDLTTDKPIHQYRNSTASYAAAAFTPDAKYYIAPGKGVLGQLNVFEAETGKEIKTLIANDPKIARPAQVHALAVSPDGKLLAALYYGNNLLIWDLEKGELLSHRRADAASGQMAFSPDGRLLTFTSGSMLHVYGTLSLQELRMVIPTPPLSAQRATYSGLPAFSPDGRYIASAKFGDTKLSIYDAIEAKDPFASEVITDVATTLKFLADGKLVAADGKSVRVLDVETAREVARQSAETVHLMPSLDRKELVWFNRQGKIVRWKPGEKPEEKESGVKPFTERPGGVPRSPAYPLVVLSPDMRFQAYYTAEGLQLYDSTSGKTTQLARFNQFDNTYGGHLTMTSNGKELIASFGSGLVRAYDCETAKEKWNYFATRNRFTPNHLHVSTNGRNYLLSTDSVKLCDMRTGFYRTEFNDDTAPPSRFGDKPILKTTMALSPDGWMMAWGQSDGVIKIFYAMSPRRPVATIQAGQGEIKALAFSDDGKWLASSGADQSIVVWKTSPTWREVKDAGMTDKELDYQWTLMGDMDAHTGFSAMTRVYPNPRMVVPFLKERIFNRKPPDPKRVESLVGQLSNPDNYTQSQAIRELIDLGEPVSNAIKKALDNNPNEMLKQRLQLILSSISDRRNSSEDRRRLRGIELLEQFGTAEARAILVDLAKGPADSEVTREAKASVERMSR